MCGLPEITALSKAPVGVPLRVLRFACGRHARMRLGDMGIMPGATIRILNKIAQDGPFKIEAGAGRFAIGAGLAGHVIVQVGGFADGKTVNLGIFVCGDFDVAALNHILNADGEGGFVCAVPAHSDFKCAFLGHLDASGKISLRGPWQRALSGDFSGFALCFEQKDIVAGLMSAVVLMQLGVRFFLLIRSLDKECAEIDLPLLSRLLRIKAYSFESASDPCSFWDIALDSIAQTDPSQYAHVPVENQAIEYLSSVLIKASRIVGKKALPFVLLCIENEDNCKVLFGRNADEIITSKNMACGSLSKRASRRLDEVLRDMRFGFVNGVIREVKRSKSCARINLSKTLDNVLLNPVLGAAAGVIVLFLSVFLLVFIGEILFGAVYLSARFLNMHSVFHKLMGALFAGFINISAVSVFLISAFATFEFFNRSNYIKRVVFLLDKAFHKIGFHGVVLPQVLKSAVCPMACPTSLAPQFVCAGKFLALGSIFYLAHLNFIAQFVLGIVFVSLSIIVSVSLYKRVDSFDAAEHPPVMDLPPYNLPKIGVVLRSAIASAAPFLKRSAVVLFLASSFIMLAFALVHPVLLFGKKNVFMDALLMITMVLNKALFVPLAAVFSAMGHSLSYRTVVLSVLLLAFLPNCPFAIRSRRAMVTGISALAAVLLYMVVFR